MDLNSKIYWFRVLLAIATGFISAFFGLAGSEAIRGFLFGIIIYIASYYILRFGFGITPESVGNGHKLMTNGLGSFIVIWIMVWALLYTLA